MHPRDLLGMGKLGGRALRHRRFAARGRLSCSRRRSRSTWTSWFESDHLKASLGWHAINDSVPGPGTPGTAYVLLHDHAAEDAGGGIRRWGFVPGGIGEVTRDDGRRRARGGRRDPHRGAGRPGARPTAAPRPASSCESGEVIEAATVLSNADPKHTFLTLCDAADLPERFLGAVDAYRCNGTSIKINLAVDRLPAAAAMNGNGAVQRLPARDHGDHLDAGRHGPGAGRGAAGRLAGQPAHRDVHPHGARPIAGARGPPRRHHRRQQPALQPGRGRAWDDLKDAARRPRDRAPGRAVPGPVVVDRAPPGAVAARPRAGARPDRRPRAARRHGGRPAVHDAARARLGVYRTPIRGLYLCGAGTHPGGGVTGANGRNAAREVLRDRRTARLRRGRR